METTIGQRIADRRKLLGLSQEALGDKMGVSRQAISKWESDAAVPEIDKLIALSKLFDVSIGWLLGTEPDAAIHDENTFSEQQLKLIEDIIRRYAAPTPAPAAAPRRSGWRFVGYICAALAALIAITALFGISTEVQQHTHQINGISSGYSSIHSALGLLSERLNELAAGEKLLSDFTFDATPTADYNAADVTFTAIPKDWQEGDSAWLAVYRNGIEQQKATCQWDGSHCTAKMQLPAENGYQFYWLVEHTDKTIQQQDVTHFSVQDLKDSLTLNCSAEYNFSVSGRKLTAGGLHMAVKLPLFGRAEDLRCTGVEWILRRNGEVIQRKAVTDFPGLETGGSYGSTGDETFTLPAPAEGDRFELCIQISLNNGMTQQVGSHAVVYEANNWHIQQDTQ